MPDYITDKIEIYSDSDREDSDEENCNKEKSDEKGLMKKIKHRMDFIFIFESFQIILSYS